MGKEIVKTITNSGKLVTRERVSLTSSLPFITKEENCFSRVLNAEELEKTFKTIKEKSKTVVNNTVNGISRDEKLFEEIIDDLSIAYYPNANVTKELLKILDSKIQSYKKNEKVLKCLEKARQDITKNNIDGEKTTKYIIAFNRHYMTFQIHNLKMTIENGLYNQTDNNIDKIIERLEKANNKDDLNNVLCYITFLARNSRRLKKVKKFYKYNSDLVLSIMVKEIIKIYVDRLISKILDSYKEKLEDDINDGKSVYEILTESNKEFDKIKTDNGVNELILKIMNDELENKLEKKSPMLCWDCSNGYVDKCPKIRDREKKSIECYPFIKSGYQIIKNDELDKFIITGCENFRKAPSEGRLSEPELREAKAKLAALFYGTETLSEGLEMQAKKKVIYIN